MAREPRAATTPEDDELDVSVVIPCLNEAGTLPAVIAKAQAAIARLGVRGEVVVSDNGSTDGSVALATQLGARVVHAPERGYGNALRHGMAQARGRVLITGDADDTYDFGEIGRFLEHTDAGAEMVMGTRLPPGTILPGANPWLHRFVGTPVLTFVLNRLFGTTIRDTNCGMRAIRRDRFAELGLRSAGMEFASEMVIKAALHRLRIDEVPVTLHPDRRGRRPHLRRWSDGWRHLEFMLLHAPDQLLFFPGIVALLFGLIITLPVSFGPRVIFGQLFDFHFLFYGGTLIFAGLQGILAALLIRDIVGGVIMRPNRIASGLVGAFTLLRALLVAAVLALGGVALEALVLWTWIRSGFGPLSEPRRSMLGMILIGTGCEIGVFSFVHAMLRKHAEPRSTGSAAPEVQPQPPAAASEGR